MYYFIEISCVIAEMWLLHMFLGNFYNTRKYSVLRVLGVYGIFGTIITVLSLLPNMAFVRLTVTFIGVWTTSMLVFDGKLLQGALSGVLYCAIVAVNDVVSAAVFQAFGVNTNAIMVNHTYRSLYLIAGHMLLFGIMIIICFINRKNKSRLPMKLLLPVLPCWLVSILLCLLFTWQCIVMEYTWHSLFLVVLLGLLYTNIIMIYFANKTGEQAQLKKNIEIAEHHYAMQQEYYDQLRVQQEETRALWHDIHKYLRALEVDKSQGALREVWQMADAIPQVVDVNNRVVSVILNEYCRIAKDAHIAIDFDVMVPPELFVTAADLYILIGNTLDNAIEACSELPEENRWITLKLKKHNRILYYEISNPYEEKHLHRSRGRYHGFGLKNVAKCVEKYGGNLDISKTDNIFRVVAHMNSLKETEVLK